MIQHFPKFCFFSTGGTIASKVDYRTGAVTPALSASDLNEAVPELGKIANIDTEVFISRNIQKTYSLTTGQKLQKNLIRLQTLTIREY